MNTEPVKDSSSMLDGKNHTFINPYSYMLLREQRPRFLKGEFFDYGYDGIALVWLSRLFGNKNVKRTSFDDTSLAPKIFTRCNKERVSLGLVGSAPGIADEAARLLKLRYPELVIDLVADGYYTAEMEEGLLAQAEKCDLVICSLGTPRQEDFLHLLRLRGWKGTGYTCGGYLDQLVSAKGGNYYPILIDQFNLRWLYRVAKEPRRLLYRYLILYPRGMFKFVFDKINKIDFYDSY